MIEKDNFRVIVGELIRNIRTQKLKISQTELANRCYLERTYISSIERGEKNISFYAMYKIIEALEIDPTDFFNQI